MIQQKNKLDEIASRHDTCYSTGKNKNECDRIMVSEIDNIPYNQRPLGIFGVKQIINTKQKLRMGNFTMENLSEELDKLVVHKFERKKAIVNYIDEIHSAHLADMKMFSKINKGYNYILTYIDIFSKYARTFPIKSKKIQNVKLCFQKLF